MNSLSNNKAPGKDNINGELLKHGASLLDKTIADIYNTAFEKPEDLDINGGVLIIIIIRCQIWNRHWRPCLSKHLCRQTTSKNLNPYFVHLLPSYKDYQEMLFVVCPYRVCLLLYQLKIRIPSLYVYTHVLKIPFASF